MRRITLIILVLLFNIPELPACVVFSFCHNGSVFAGNNEDSFDPDTRLIFKAAGADGYGCLLWGYEKHDYAQGGVNEHGLFWDGTAVPYCDYSPDQAKMEFTDHFFEYVLRKCRTLDEALLQLDKYSWEAFPTGNYLLADKSGASAIIGVGKDGRIAVKRKDEAYQVLSNFNVFDPEAGGYPDRRYELVSELLSSGPLAEAGTLSRVLARVHQEFIVQTVYSQVCDLQNGLVYLYYFHDYTLHKVIDLKAELMHGDRIQPMASLFEDTYANFIYSRFQPKPVTDLMKPLALAGRTDRAIAIYDSLGAAPPAYYTYYKYDLSPGLLAGLSRELLDEGAYAAALGIARKCLEADPAAGEASFLAGEACYQMDDLERARDYFLASKKAGWDAAATQARLEDLRKRSDEP